MVDEVKNLEEIVELKRSNSLKKHFWKEEFNLKENFYYLTAQTSKYIFPLSLLDSLSNVRIEPTLINTVITFGSYFLLHHSYNHRKGSGSMYFE